MQATASKTRELPILFSTDMVRAIIEGRKTQTRRVVKGTALKWLIVDEFTPEFVADPDNFLCRYGYPGNLLYVRETWQYIDLGGGDEGYVYKASENGETWEREDEGWTWKPSIHMPKEAARIWLKVTDVRVERLQDMSESDILSEGVRVPCGENSIYFKVGENTAWQFMPQQWKVDRYVENRGKEKYVHNDYDFLFAHWAELWCEINGRESWDLNPWVWVISFEVLSTTGKQTM